MYGFQGLGDCVSDGTCTGPAVVPGAASTVTSCPDGYYLSAGGTCLSSANLDNILNLPTTPASNVISSNPLISAAVLSDVFNPPAGTTFLQWVNDNSTVLLVAFGAIGALVALTRMGK